MQQLPLGFLAARMLVSGSLSMAAQSSPDLLHAPHRTQAEAAALAARIDMLSALSQFASRPLWGSAIDSFGRKPVLVAGCFLSFIARATAARFPKSDNAYLFYRILNVNAVLPVMQASNALLADACGGRQTDLYIKMNRRLFMLLAVVRIAFTRLAASRAAKGDTAASILMWAARSILISGIVFSLTVKETLKYESRAQFSILNAVKSSAIFFLKSKRRLFIALALTLRILPMFSGSSMMALQKYDYGWGATERALLSNVSDAADVLCPLVLNEIMQVKPKKGREALVWGSRFATLAMLNIAMTPYPKSILFNTILERLVSSQPFFDEMLEQERISDGNIGEGLLDSAVSTLEFPVGMIVPPLLMQVTSKLGYRAPYYLLALAMIFNGEVLSRVL